MNWNDKKRRPLNFYWTNLQRYKTAHKYARANIECSYKNEIIYLQCHCCTYPQLVSANFFSGIFFSEIVLFKYFLACKTKTHQLAKLKRIPNGFKWWALKDVHCWVKTTLFVANKSYVITHAVEWFDSWNFFSQIKSVGWVCVESCKLLRKWRTARKFQHELQKSIQETYPFDWFIVEMSPKIERL